MEILLVNGDDLKALQLAELFNCQTGTFPLRYLGVPVSPSRLHIKDWVPLEEKNEKMLALWKGKTLSIAGRTTLIKASLTNTFIYHMSMYLLPKTTTERLDKQRRKFFLARRGSKKEIPLSEVEYHKQKQEVWWPGNKGY